MDWFGNILGEVNTLLYSYVLIVLLVGTGIFLTFKTKFIQFRLIKEMFKLITEAAPTDKSGKKGISSFPGIYNICGFPYRYREYSGCSDGNRSWRSWCNFLDVDDCTDRCGICANRKYVSPSI